MAANEPGSGGSSLWSLRALYVTWLHVSILASNAVLLIYIFAPMRGMYLDVGFKEIAMLNRPR